LKCRSIVNASLRDSQNPFAPNVHPKKVTMCFFELYGIITFNNFFFHLGSNFGLTLLLYEKSEYGSQKPEWAKFQVFSVQLKKTEF
jgi:hypothetical protein